MRLVHEVTFEFDEAITLDDLRQVLRNVDDAPGEIVPIIKIESPTRSLSFRWVVDAR